MSQTMAPPCPAPADAPAAPTDFDAAIGPGRFLDIPPDLIDPDPDQPRTEADPEALHGLAESLALHGQLQPIAVRPGDAPGRYALLCGARRLAAARIVGLPALKAWVLDVSPPADRRLELQVVENVQREDMSPLDQAPAFRALMDRRGWSGRRLAAQLRLSPSTISRALALLDLPEADRDDLASGRVAASRLRPDRRDPDKPPPDPDPDAPAAPTTRRPGSNARPRRTFAVAGGRATLILDGPGGLTEFAELAVAVALQLMDEAKAAQT